MLSAGDTDLTGYSFAGELARRKREVVGCGDKMVGAGDSIEIGEPSSTTVVGTGSAMMGWRSLPGPVRMREGRICSKPWSRATFSMDLKYYSRRRVSSDRALVRAGDDGLEIWFSP